MKRFIVCLLFLICIASFPVVWADEARKKPELAVSDALLLEDYLSKYTYWRKVLTKKAKLPEDAAMEELRPFICQFLAIDKDTGWHDISKDEYLGRWLTEKNRKKFVRLLGLVPDAGWVMIATEAERLWRERYKELKRTDSQAPRSSSWRIGAFLLNWPK